MKKYVVFILISLLFACNSKQESNIQPNILWLTFEDTSPQFIGCYGNEAAKTPTIDMLASDGVQFSAAFSTGTVCSPSRFTLITGCRTTSYGTGYHRSNYPISEEVEAFPKYLREAGYYTSNNSKTDYNTSKAKHFIQTAWDESSNKAGWWNREPGQPFFAVFNSFHSHQSRTMTNPWWKYKEQVLDQLDSAAVIGDNDFEVPPIFNDTPEMRKELSRIYNAIQLSDNQFAEILSRLSAEGLADSTIIFCFSDHGEGMPWGKGYSRGLGYRVPFIIYFPEMYRHLSPWGTSVITDDIIDFADLPPTVLSLAGIAAPDYIEGRPLLGKFAEKSKKNTIGALDRTEYSAALSRSISDGEFSYTKNFMPFQSEKRWQKYFNHAQISHLILSDFRNNQLTDVQSGLLRLRNSETLYNLIEDTWETENLIDNEEYVPMIEDFKRTLKQDLISHRDAHFIPEYTLQKNELAPIHFAQNDSIYPAAEIISTAFNCGLEDALSSHLENLSHDNNILRYWSAVGVYSHFRMFGKPNSILDLQEDKYPPANIFIQASKAQFLDDKDAEYTLLEYLKGDDEQLAILAAQLLIQPDTIDAELLKIILDYGNSTIFASVKQRIELFDYKYNNVALTYKNYW